MKKILVSLILSIVFAFGIAHTRVAPVNAEDKGAANRIETVKAGKEEGTIDKEFFKKIAVEKPSNVTVVDVRTPFEYQAGHFEGAPNIFINDLFNKGCEPTLARLPKEGYIVFVCATGARAGEMYFGIVDDCKYKDSKRLFFLDATVDYTPNGPVVR